MTHPAIQTPTLDRIKALVVQCVGHELLYFSQAARISGYPVWGVCVSPHSRILYVCDAAGTWTACDSGDEPHLAGVLAAVEAAAKKYGNG